MTFVERGSGESQGFDRTQVKNPLNYTNLAQDVHFMLSLYFSNNCMVEVRRSVGGSIKRTMQKTYSCEFLVRKQIPKC